ncbi:hypothetical protein FOL47_010523 [Perkinsus chesapeaki]|uniref:Uncharacterized protein n=1 Tax=Perkinsus chesapeaki TaxID=330153 RepID=A0A7J6MR66_PERCH|nr:hypothetical protein FOL47_010523 [Perkinsus chesapeaki]
MSRGPQLVSGPSGTAAPAGGGGEQTRGLTFREDVGHGTGNAFTVMIPSVFAKIDKQLPMVNRKEIMEAYGKLSNTARQSLLTIVDKEFVARLMDRQRAAWCARMGSGDHSDSSSKHPRLMQLFDTTNHNLLPEYEVTKQQPATFKDGYMLLEDNGPSNEIDGRPDALQPRMRALMNHSLFDFIDERCDDFLRNAKRNRSRLVTRKEVLYSRGNV